MDKPIDQYIVDQSTLYERHDVGSFRGYRKLNFKAATPLTRWDGHKIPDKLWREIVSFFVWSYREYKCETQCRLYHDPGSGEWFMRVFPQYVTGNNNMHTDEVPLDNEEHADLIKEIFASIPETAFPWGTVHSHCDMSAFQSGTDHNNEHHQDGIHITLGKLASEEIDIHARVSYFGCMSNAVLQDWFEFPEGWNTLPTKLLNDARKWYLCYAPKESIVPPQEIWKRCMIKKEPLGSVGSYKYGAFFSENHYPKHIGLPSHYQNGGNGKPKDDDDEDSFDPKAELLDRAIDELEQDLALMQYDLAEAADILARGDVRTSEYETLSGTVRHVASENKISYGTLYDKLINDFCAEIIEPEHEAY